MRLLITPVLFSLLYSSFGIAFIGPNTPIPRAPSKEFLAGGLFEGGKMVPSNIEALRFSAHPKEGFERWVLDFSEPKSLRIGEVAPRFQLRYVKADKINEDGAQEMVLEPPRFIFMLRKIEKNFLKPEKLKRLVAKSRFVQNVVLYPPVEEGDTAIEFILKDNVLFQAHQPAHNEGRIVLDIKAE